MIPEEVARWFLTALLLGAASSVTTALVTQDTFPFGEWRDRRVYRHPMLQQSPAVDDWDEELDENGEPRLVPTFTGSRLTYLVTCPRCFGVWSTAAWFALYWITARGAIIAGTVVAAMAVQRFLNRIT